MAIFLFVVVWNVSAEGWQDSAASNAQLLRQGRHDFEGRVHHIIKGGVQKNL